MSFIKLLIVQCLLAIVLSLGAGIYHMVSDQGKQGTVARSRATRSR